MSKVGVGGLVCSIIGLVLLVLMAFTPVLFIAIALLGGAELIAALMFAFQFGGLILGILGLILGIVGAAKDEKKAPGIVGIVFGSIDLVLSLLFLGIFAVV
jgi:hypothetical protein